MIPPHVRQAVLHRSEGFCERCGAGNPTDVHHRRPRGMGGSKELDYAENLVALCRTCHTWIESHREAATSQGWLVPKRSGLTPEETPIYIHGSWYFVTAERMKPVDLEPPF